MSETAITVETLVSAPRLKVWDSWTSPEDIVRWNFASDDWYCPKAVNDVQQGGKFSFIMSSRDGKMSFDFNGIYDEVVQGEMLSYTIADGRKVKVRFEEMDGQTRVSETFEPEHTNPFEMQRAGWQSILDNFKKHTES